MLFKFFPVGSKMVSNINIFPGMYWGLMTTLSSVMTSPLTSCDGGSSFLRGPWCDPDHAVDETRSTFHLAFLSKQSDSVDVLISLQITSDHRNWSLTVRFKVWWVTNWITSRPPHAASLHHSIYYIVSSLYQHHSVSPHDLRTFSSWQPSEELHSFRSDK